MTDEGMARGSEQHDFVIAQLSSLLDGELSDAERVFVEEHLHACQDCRVMLDELRAVKAWVSSDPPSAADRAACDAWYRLRASLPAPGSRPRRGRWGRGLLAASLLIGVVASAAWWRTRSSGAPVRTANGSAVSASAGSPVSEPLEALAYSRLATLPPSQARALQASLAIIDSAIADARTARMADRTNEFVASYLDDLLKRKADALRAVVAMADAERTS